MTSLDRRTMLGAAALLAAAPAARAAEPGPARLSLNENPFGPSRAVRTALAQSLAQINRYGDDRGADILLDRIAQLERIPRAQIVLGEILDALGLFLAAQPPVGGRFVLSTPGYTAMVDAGRPIGAVAVGVPLDAQLRNDLPALRRAVAAGARAIYLVNPHNPSGTANDPAAYDAFIRDVSANTLVIVDEAYLEYDDIAQSAVRFIREGRNVAVFRTLDKIYGLAGLPTGYVLAPAALAASLRSGGLGDPHELGRLAIAAATAALGDQAWVAQVRSRTISGRARLTAALDRLNLEHSDSRANFVFFRAPAGAAQKRKDLARHGIIAAHAFPPLDEWIRITIGTEDEVTRTITALERVFPA